MEQGMPNPEHFILILIITTFTWSSGAALSPDLKTSAIGLKFNTDPAATKSAATDWGLIVKETPMAVFNPESTEDVLTLVNLAYASSAPFGVAARGQSHSARGQAQAGGGIVLNMTSLNNFRHGRGVVVGGDAASGYYADVGGEQLWIDVLRATLRRGLTPLSWTDYLYLTVGGTLSNAGISGETFRFGPQINNVYEMDVITGTGEFVSCSRENNSELFYAVLGGLGQFGIITRARIALGTAPTRVKWVRLLYSDFAAFSKDQERLILKNTANPKNAVDYVEGAVLMANAPAGWLNSFYSASDVERINPLVNKFGIIYSLEVAHFYVNKTTGKDKDLKLLFNGLKHESGFRFERDVSYMNFLNRVRTEEKQLRSIGLWEVPHPWMNLFVPGTQISEFNSKVFEGMMLRANTSTPLILLYPMLQNKWDNKMSAVTPDSDIFYAVGLLHSCGFDNWEAFDSLNAEILKVCDDAGVKYKQYLPHYSSEEDWVKHFGSKWETFKSRKAQFDPKMILSPGQGIFNN